MRKTFGKFVLGTSALALTALAPIGGSANAASTSAASSTTTTDTTVAPQEYYSTTSSIGSDPTVSGPVGFNPITSGSFGLNSQVGLGEFTVSTLADGSSKTYANTPFTITYNPVKVGNTAFGTMTPITLNGTLNGTITGNQSSVVATFDTASSPAFSTPDGSYKSVLSVLNTPLGLVPASAGGRTTIQGLLTTTYAAPAPAGTGTGPTVPEPTTLAILATSIVGLGLRKRLRSARKPA